MMSHLIHTVHDNRIAEFNLIQPYYRVFIFHIIQLCFLFLAVV
jgi:hypothetical protein